MRSMVWYCHAVIESKQKLIKHISHQGNLSRFLFILNIVVLNIDYHRCARYSMFVLQITIDVSKMVFGAISSYSLRFPFIFFLTHFNFTSFILPEKPEQIKEVFIL